MAIRSWTNDRIVMMRIRNGGLRIEGVRVSKGFMTNGWNLYKNGEMSLILAYDG
jgi:hypothetical protein